MTKTESIMELMEGYRTYSSPQSLNADRSGEDAPETTPFCQSVAFSIATSVIISATVHGGC